MSAQDTATPKEIGLMTLCKRRRYQVSELTDQLTIARNTACEMLYDGVKAFGHDKAEKMVLRYRRDCGGQEQAYYPTRIGEYENKKGHKSMAHFSRFNNYLGSTTKLGDRPILVLQWIEVSKKNIKEGYWKVSPDTKLMYPVKPE